MKKILSLVFAIFLTLSLVTAVGPAPLVDIQTGSSDSECSQIGLVGRAKYQCDNETPPEGDTTGLTVTWHSTDGGCTGANWTADPAVAAVLTKDGVQYYQWDGGTEGSVYNAGQQSISHMTFCGRPSENVPEFTSLGALAALGLAGLFVYKKRN